ncbi:MAG: GAF domain-containing protein, partial [Silvibacterium sp.]|nr:GAF domain-containing protein [Silvibacterium sp.]
MPPTAATEVAPELNERALRVLVEASAALVAAADVNTLLDRVLDCSRILIGADACGVWRSLDGGYNWRMLASAGLSDWPVSQLKVPDPTLIPDVAAIEDVRSYPILSSRTDWYISQRIYSLLCIALRIGGTLAATVTFYYRAPHSFTDSEIQYARVLANLSASTLYMTELKESQQRERARLKFLAESSAVLSSSLDYQKTLNTVARLAVPYLSDWCTVSMYEDEKLTSIAAAHVDPEKQLMLSQAPQEFKERLHESRGTGAVLATGKPLLYESISDALLASVATNEEHLGWIRSLGIVSAIVVPLKSRHRVLGVIHFLTDQSGRRFSEDDLRLAEDLAARASTAIDNARLFRGMGLSESRYRSLIEASSSLAYTVDGKSNFVEPQPAWSAYTGQRWEELRGMGWVTALHPDDRERIIEQLRLATGIIQPQVFRARLWNAISGSYRHCMARSVPMRNESGGVEEWVGVIIDVHDQMLAEEKLRRTEQLATAGRLAATVAHEINNPLESVTNLVYLAQQSPKLDQTTRGYLDIATGELQRVAQIVRQTLGFYRESASPKNADVGEIAAEVLSLNRRNFVAKEIRVTSAIEPGVTACVVSGEIRQVIANLVTNAIEASSPHSEIRVELKQFDETVLIRIADHGTGISEENLPHLFEAFFTTKKDVGTGLGLWVSRGLIEKHNGTLTVETKTGGSDHGTTFTITLPA